jgi:hypothetical protein
VGNYSAQYNATKGESQAASGRLANLDRREGTLEL